MKSRKLKEIEYIEKYIELPNSQDELIQYIRNNNKINDKTIDDYIKEYNQLEYETYKIVLYENPGGYKRHRAALHTKGNSSKIHIYSPDGKIDNNRGKYLTQNMKELKEALYNPLEIIQNAYIQTPNSYTANEKLLAEMGYIKPMVYPDWDNIAKKYCDMFNENLFIDDRIIVKGTVNKFYSIKPRLEIIIVSQNKIYTKKQAKQIATSTGKDISELEYLI